MLIRFGIDRYRACGSGTRGAGRAAPAADGAPCLRCAPRADRSIPSPVRELTGSESLSLVRVRGESASGGGRRAEALGEESSPGGVDAHIATM